jgi:hypothetical protein
MVKQAKEWGEYLALMLGEDRGILHRNLGQNLLISIGEVAADSEWQKHRSGLEAEEERKEAKMEPRARTLYAPAVPGGLAAPVARQKGPHHRSTLG